VTRRSWLLTPAQEQVVDRLGDVRIGQRLFGDDVYVYDHEAGHTLRYLLSAAGEVLRKDDLGPADRATPII
jgi:hypothetical protein